MDSLSDAIEQERRRREQEAQAREVRDAAEEVDAEERRRHFVDYVNRLKQSAVPPDLVLPEITDTKVVPVKNWSVKLVYNIVSEPIAVWHFWVDSRLDGGVDTWFVDETGRTFENYGARLPTKSSRGEYDGYRSIGAIRYRAPNFSMILGENHQYLNGHAAVAFLLAENLAERGLIGVTGPTGQSTAPPVNFSTPQGPTPEQVKAARVDARLDNLLHRWPLGIALAAGLAVLIAIPFALHYYSNGQGNPAIVSWIMAIGIPLTIVSGGVAWFFRS